MAEKPEKLDSKTKMETKGYTYNDIKSHLNNVYQWKINNTRIYIFEALLNFIKLSCVWVKKVCFNLFFTCSCMEYIIFLLNESWTDDWIQFKAEFQKHGLLIN